MSLYSAGHGSKLAGTHIFIRNRKTGKEEMSPAGDPHTAKVYQKLINFVHDNVSIQKLPTHDIDSVLYICMVWYLRN